MQVLNLINTTSIPPLHFINTLEYAGYAIALAVLFLLCSIKPLAILQQCGYKNGKMLHWYSRKDNLLFQRYCLLFMMLALTSGLLGICFTFLGEEVSYRIALLPFPLFCILFYVLDKKYALKVPVNETERFKRLALVYVFLLAVIFYLFIAVFNVIAYYVEYDLVGIWRYVPLSLIPFALPAVVCAANALDGVYENARNKKYVNRAKEKLSRSGMIKIGVTGSFGKTSVKNILSRMLGEKYAVLSTPASYNTPMGIAKCVNESDLSAYEVFVAEMGARNIGDIAELCDIVKPDHSVLTGICAQHLESFKSIETVILAKSEIVLGTKNGGTVVVGRDENTQRVAVDSAHNAVWLGNEQIKDLVCSSKGTSFTLVYGEEEVKIHTKLLGKHTAQNIALAAALSLRLGITPEQIAAACEDLEYVPHRLQVIENGGVTVLDDSYNANVKGAEQAVEVLKSFDGRKIIVTPGIVEMGILEEKANENLGASLVGLDAIILVGDTLVGAVKSGYLSAGGDKERLQVVPTLRQAQALLAETVQSGDTVLFLNDLPDVY